jgi:hypothetical protein
MQKLFPKKTHKMTHNMNRMTKLKLLEHEKNLERETLNRMIPERMKVK